MIHEAMLFEPGEDLKVNCLLCAHRCKIAEGKRGICRVRENRGGTLFTLIYASTSSVAVDPVEKKPFYHFYPGTYAYSMGTVSCNFRCKHCQNAPISAVTIDNFPVRDIPPEEAISSAKARGCRGITWTYNEPTIWFEYTYDSAKIAKREGLYTGYVTNGYMTEEALNEIAPYLDAANVDVKSFEDDFYRKICGARLQPVLDSCERMVELGMHIEITYLVIPTLNDRDELFERFTEWVFELDPSIPVHFTRFHPDYQMRDIISTPFETLERAYRIARGKGLEYVYIGNVDAPEYNNTYCPECGELVIERRGLFGGVKVHLDPEDRCPVCGRKVLIIRDHTGSHEA
ncbi:MAG TPA: AmmeMemoRadiSam system radical SAM enzyme [Candidatus Syntrophoarchaeum butanivorans]|uniref:AmmeMemoRadiSam system radical SAM enzyme n=1 Tax=Candidatus Syntropharchaeum butanivorans TaxID=1839936 RepID=A0A1F2P3L7_9EURY|nr:MAG: radical SAM protein [Candidatus Syntrophoarchaeum butanivorans]HEC56308.1 AmmeMemoRadiSam system radical SAM enzyme [Candidatus Syntrophoarchaeum butanivorans]